MSELNTSNYASFRYNSKMIDKLIIFCRRKYCEVFNIDLYSLALFRISLAILILCDLFNRSQHLVAHYTDIGVLPRSALIQKFLNNWYFSFHFLGGNSFYQGCLFILAAIFAIGLLIGYRTTLMTFLSWIMLLSLCNRNHMVLQSGDTLLRMLLFWSMFLPLGARYSIDHALNSKPDRGIKCVVNIGTTALLIQTCIVYWMVMLHRVNSEIWWSGQGVYYALNLDAFATQFGVWLRQFDELLVVLGYMSIYIEFIFPILVFFPFFTKQLRMLCVSIMISFHLGMGATMELGLFPLISIVSWIPFIPSCVWNKIKKWIMKHHDPEFKIYYDSDCSFCVKSSLLMQTFFLLPRSALLPVQENPEVFEVMKKMNSWVVVDKTGNFYTQYEGFICICRNSPILRFISPFISNEKITRIGNWCYRKVSENREKISDWLWLPGRRPVFIGQSVIGGSLCLFFLLIVIVWNLRTVHFKKYFPIFPVGLKNLAYVLRINQDWRMFSPNPASNDGWFVIPTQLLDGREVDMFTGGGPLKWDKPENVFSTFGSQRIRKYMMNIRKKENKKYRPYYGKYLSRTWNKTHQNGDKALKFQVYYMKEKTYKDRIGKPEKIVLWRHLCYKKGHEPKLANNK